jgi:hypothetical protein
MRAIIRWNNDLWTDNEFHQIFFSLMSRRQCNLNESVSTELVPSHIIVTNFWHVFLTHLTSLFPVMQNTLHGKSIEILSSDEDEDSDEEESETESEEGKSKRLSLSAENPLMNERSDIQVLARRFFI